RWKEQGDRSPEHILPHPLQPRQRTQRQPRTLQVEGEQVPKPNGPAGTHVCNGKVRKTTGNLCDQGNGKCEVNYLNLSKGATAKPPSTGHEGKASAPETKPNEGQKRLRRVKVQM
ncbi:unnamed protein product, partial [Ectocarpus fasciculatus]